MRPHCDIVGPEPHCANCGVPARVMNVRRHCPARKRGTCGVGCQLTKTFKWFGIRDDGKCGCAEYAAELDASGPDRCEGHIDDLVARLMEKAAARSIVLGAVPAAVVVPVVRRAIAAARAELDGKAP